jgi:hypothetical protein
VPASRKTAGCAEDRERFSRADAARANVMSASLAKRGVEIFIGA